MEVLDMKAEGGHIDEETYRQLANILMEIHSTLQDRATTQASAAHLPVRPPARGWQAPTRVSAETLAVAVTAIQQGASVAHAAQQHGISDILDMNRLTAALSAKPACQC
jgi:hypothetical protein